MQHKPTGAGGSTFDLVDVSHLFAEAGLDQGQVVLDVGCGPGDYALAAARRVTNSGKVYAIDLWEDAVESLKSHVEARGIRNLDARVADVSERIPVDDDTVDVALMVAVLHDLLREGRHDAALKEITRVLDPGGTVAVVEFQKKGGSPGPPIDVRLGPEEVVTLLHSHGLQFLRTGDAGPYHYVSIFRLGDGSSV